MAVCSQTIFGAFEMKHELEIIEEYTPRFKYNLVNIAKPVFSVCTEVDNRMWDYVMLAKRNISFG